MGIKIIKGEIKIIIETLEEQYAVINQQNGKIPQIELDIIMSNIRKLYERLCDLNKLNSLEGKEIFEEIQEIIPQNEPEKVAEPVLISVEETVVEKTEPEITSAVKDEISTAIEEEITETAPPVVNLEKTKEIIFEMPEIPAEETITPRVVEEDKNQPIVEVKPVKPGKKESVDLFSLAEKETLADKFKDNQKSVRPLADKIATDKTDQTLADKIGKASIVNLKNAIGINDKFLFINELFKGDIQEYNKTIDKLNSFTNLQECTFFLEDVKAGFNWVEKPDTYQKLEDLVLRKFL